MALLMPLWRTAQRYSTGLMANTYAAGPGVRGYCIDAKDLPEGSDIAVNPKLAALAKRIANTPIQAAEVRAIPAAAAALTPYP
jgi:hypothetical protein